MESKPLAGQCIAEVRIFGFGFAPAGWVECNGRVLSIAEHQPLFSVLGWRFGGDGDTTFAVPSLREELNSAIIFGIAVTGMSVGSDHDG